MDYEKSLQDIIFKMLCDRNYMFYGLFLAELNKEFSDDFPTACVSKHKSSSNINLVIGKKFWEKTLYNDSRKMAILIHELEHVVREHLSEFSSGMFPDKHIANIAMDISINQCISEELPRKDENGEKCGVYIEDFPELKLKEDESSLYYYNALKKAQECKENSKGSKDSKNPSKGKGNKLGTSGSKVLDEILDSIEDGKQDDWHKLWEELKEGMGEKELSVMNKEIQERIARIAEETEKMRGNIPTHIQNAVKNNFNNKKPIVSWKTLFNRFVGSTITTEIKQTKKRPNFRFEDAPSNRYKNKVKIVVGVDSSGSVSESDLEEFFGQIKHMWKAGVKVDVCIWDTNVHLEYEYKGENKYERVCQGGTYASSFIQYVNKNKRKKNWTCAINLTDGFIEDEPAKCNLPMLWVITGNGSISFKHKGKKIKMKH